MNLNVSGRKNGRTYLSIEKRYRDKTTRKSTGTTIRALGYLDELEKEFSDPITHFKEVARQMTAEDNARKKVSITINMDECLPEKTEGTKNLGYALPMKIYHEISLHEFLKAKMGKEAFKYNTNSIMLFLVMSHLLYPGSKEKAFDHKAKFFERFDFELADVYRVLTHFNTISEDLQRFLYSRIRRKYGSDTSTIYYNMTNYYFENCEQDELRRYQKTKQNHKKPIIQMGLVMDASGMPMHYELFPENRLDRETFRSVIGEVRKNYNTDRIIIVKDMGIITSDNIYDLVNENPEKPRSGYVFSFPASGGSKAFKEYILNPSGYIDSKGNPAADYTDFMVKSRQIRREINVTVDCRRKQNTKHVYEKQVVFWSKKYFLKARAERAEVIAKAEALVSDPKKYDKATANDAAAYIDGPEFDKETGEVIIKRLTVNYDKIKEEEKYDGYYAIVTSEHEMSNNEIIDIYHGLCEIKETFRIIQGSLETLPVYVNYYENINAHFLTCFIALAILRIIRMKTGGRHSAETIIENLKLIECMNEHENIYLFGHRNEITDELGNTFGIDFTRKRLRLADIKKILGDVKK